VISPDSVVLNDVHSQLNPTVPRAVARPRTLQDVQALIRSARSRALKISVAGGRHAMGGQQFAHDGLHIDMGGLRRVLGSDPAAGLLSIEAGADWNDIIAATHAMPGQWGIRQKQTGVDAVSLGGSISANAHGRGLAMQPLGDDIEDLTLVTAEGDVVRCSRAAHPELFSLAIGGYGLFGIIYCATLRLARRQRVRRVVDVIDLEDAIAAAYRRAGEGFLYGDFQFAIDPQDDRFLRRGVMASYKPCAAGQPDASADLPPEAWLQLLQLAHTDKRQAFQQYASHYLATDGNCYWSDTMQLSTYIPSYAEYLESERVASVPVVKETLVIGEHYVPPDRLVEFMRRAGEILRSHGTELIYGTIRSIRSDTVSWLPWARDDFACIVFNLRTPHTEAGRQRTADCFRALTDASIGLGGSFFLTYHRHASAAQVEAGYPRFREWLALKRRYDPGELFCSDWYRHYMT
jgi:FAD/FMN-containing dehydrogenase